jgi:hypothetical protein
VIVPRLALLLALLLLLPAARAATRSPDEALEQGKLAYQRHDYREVEDTLRPLLYPTVELPNEDKIVEARRLLALSYFFQKKMPEARQEVISILSVRPGFELDPIVEPLVAVRFFENIRKEQDERLQEIRRRRRIEDEVRRREEERRREEARRKAERVFVEKKVRVNSRLVATLPFGIGQFQNGNRRLGIALAVTETTLAALSLASFITLEARYPTNEVPVAEANLLGFLRGMQYGGGAAFWALALAGIIEAHARFVPEVVTTREIPRPKAASFLPVAGPGMIGLSLGGTF